jgi:RimJ/RimL family protein N-acetyltransferase
MDAIRLEPFGERHLDEVTAMLDDRDVLRFTRIPDPPPADFARHWLDRYAAGRGDGTREAFAALDGGGALLGLALAPEIDREGHDLELGYLVVPAGRGRGAATRILTLLTEWAFEEAGALRARLVIDVANPASERVAQRCGYVREGVMRSVHFKAEQRIDAGLWSRLPTDPAPAATAGPRA